MTRRTSILIGLACLVAGGYSLVKVSSPEESPMRRFYLSGPMRGIEKFNFPAFDAAAAAGRAKGYGVMSPADMDRELGHTENDDLAAINTHANQRRFAGRDCAALLALQAENGDGIALLPGWEKSTGALAELTLARWLGLCVVDAETWEPIEVTKFTDLDLTPVIRNLRKYIGDPNFEGYFEHNLD